ncbi:zinc finger protein 609-like isoform X1 [Neolamprologus brichardi]|uniref:zinc finger protein 609-like isoform X1 n=1 Tax=Neolamprologus brichardi TaxID=32507 RepID=UPI0003EC410E|nr:zinc finger protein 609-like isoform X1 [Neolamprologus brichardi]XP_035765010.1 zinc finger protein 609-like isoform X1 [Neolamprologus brichardi]
MSLSGGTAGGKGVDSNAVDTYDSGDEWDIGVGNLIIDLDADLEKDKLEMSGTKDGMAAPPSAVAALPDNIRFVSPVSGSQGKESKSKYKRSKNSKDNNNKASAGDGGKKETTGRTQGEPTGTAASAAAAGNNSTSGKNMEKVGKASRGVLGGKKEKDGASGKSKKDKTDGAPVVAIGVTEKDVVSQAQVALGNSRNASFENTQSADLADANQMGNIALEPVGIVPALTTKTEPEEVENGNGECKTLKKVKNEKMESPVSTPAPPPLHLLATVGNSEIASPCEQIMVRTRSVAVNTSDVALSTEPECLGPCEPGTSVNLEGIVWQETEDGMLVVNVTWRNKTYVGTLLDCTRHDWAPPRFCESPTSDLEMRNGRGRGKRMRPNSNTPLNENSNSSDSKGTTNNKTRAASNSKGRRGSQTPSERRTPPNSNTEDIKASPSSAGKRKTKPTSDMEPNSSSEDTKGNKRMRTNSNSGGVGPTGLPISSIKTEPLPPPLDRSCPSPVLIDCPHPNCNKKYKHINGLKYHQARAHNDDDIKLDLDGDSEYGEDSTLHPEPGNCNGASISQKGCLSPARSATPKGRNFDAQSPSPSPGKFGSKQSKKKIAETDAETGSTPMDGCEDGPCLTDEASNDGIDDKRGSEKSKKANTSAKTDKKNLKSPRPIGPGPTATQQIYSFPPGNPNSSPGLTQMMQGIPKSPQMKGTQPKPPAIGDPASSSSKDKKKKDKKKKDGGKEADSPKPPGKGGKLEEGKLPYSEPCDQGNKGEGLLNGSSETHQSRLASIKAEADKIYSFSDNAPSPSIGVASRIDGSGMPQTLTPLHVVNQNGADNSSVKTNSPAYSDISDAGEDGEGKLEAVKVRTEDQAIRESVKKALFPNQTPNKDSPYYPGYDTYYSPNYVNPSPGGPNPGTTAAEGQVKIKRDDEQDQVEEKVKVEVHEDRKPDSTAPAQQQQQPSVIQQRSNMYMQPLYYNQYAYVPPYAYHPDQAYLMSTNPAYRQQYEERQRQMAEQHRAAEKKSDVAMKERESSMKDEWKQKSLMPPSLSKTPSQSDLGKAQQQPSKSRDSPSEPTSKSMGTIKGEDSKSQQPEGLKMKLTEGGHHGKEDPKQALESRGQAGLEQAMWFRQQYPESQKSQAEDEHQQQHARWKDREHDRKLKDERPRPKDSQSGPKEDSKESSDPRITSEDHRAMSKDSRSNPHMQFSSPLAQHQGYMPYMHGYPYGQGYDPNHPGYRGMPSVMMQNYPGSYLPGGYPFSPYGSKIAGAEEGSDKSRASPTVTKTATDSKALDNLHLHTSQYKSKSPTVGDKPPHDREREQDRGASGDRDRERERDVDRPRSSPSQRIMPSHHHLGYPLQYDLSYATGKPDRHTSTLQRFI